MPSITWIKNDDALAVQSYDRIRVAEIFVDDEQIHSQLVIKGVKREDNGKCYCLQIIVREKKHQIRHSCPQSI